MSDDEPQNPEADWHFTHAEMMAHDAALLKAQSTELALCKTRARWVQVVVAELNADLGRTEAERDAALATLAEARNDRILSRGVQEATEWAESAVTIAENEMTRQHRDRYLAAPGCVCLLDITHGHNNSLDWHACHRCTNTWPQNSVRPVCLSNLT